jgi:uncharacterized UPF0146 family protein
MSAPLSGPSRLIYRLNELAVSLIAPDSGVAQSTALITAYSDNITPTTVMLYDGAEVPTANRGPGNLQGQIADTGAIGTHDVTLADAETGHRSESVPFEVALT